jgi:hypothetical protein
MQATKTPQRTIRSAVLRHIHSAGEVLVPGLVKPGKRDRNKIGRGSAVVKLLPATSESTASWCFPFSSTYQRQQYKVAAYERNICYLLVLLSHEWQPVGNQSERVGEWAETTKVL